MIFVLPSYLVLGSIVYTHPPRIIFLFYQNYWAREITRAVSGDTLLKEVLNLFLKLILLIM